MVSINASVQVNASPERIWGIISDVDRESEFWKGLNSSKVTKREGNVVEREVNVGFMGHKGHQIVRLNPKSSIEVELKDGPLIGSRDLRLLPLGAEKTSLEASWNFSFSKVPIFARGFVKSQIENVTKEALEKIALEAEGTNPRKKVVALTSSK